MPASATAPVDRNTLLSGFRMSNGPPEDNCERVAPLYELLPPDVK